MDYCIDIASRCHITILLARKESCRKSEAYMSSHTFCIKQIPLSIALDVSKCVINSRNFR